MKLTKTECDRLRPQEKKYKRFDGGGLFLEVTPTGTKNWRLKYYYLGKQKIISFGPYPVITLLKAREKRDEAKRLLLDGIDPAKRRREVQLRLQEKLNTTFESISREWFKKQQERWSTAREKHVLKVLEKNIFPYLGEAPISDIEAPDLFRILEKIEKRGAYYTTNKTNQICGQIFRYAIRTGRCKNNPAEQLVGAFKRRPTKHYASIMAAEIPELLKALQKNDSRLFQQTRHAVLFSLLTFCRPGEIRRARWQDIDLENALWTVPAQFMKSRKDHMVPLAIQTLDLLEKQREITSAIRFDWVFPSLHRPKNPMSDGTVNRALKRLGFDKRMTAHGFRALARTTIREKLKYYPDIIEAQLAHKPPGPFGAAYDRSQFIDDRIKMMQDWADYIASIN